MFVKCDALLKGDLLDMVVFWNPFPLFLFEILSIPPVRSLRFLKAAVGSAISWFFLQVALGLIPGERPSVS